MPKAIDDFLSKDEFPELHRLRLAAAEWEALEAFQRILEVNLHFRFGSLFC